MWSGSAASWVNLNPPGAFTSFAYGAAGGQQVGGAAFTTTGRAGMWQGTAVSYVDLQPPGTSGSAAFGTDGTHQVGWVNVTGLERASLWSGTAASWVNLEPAGASGSHAYAVKGNYQVGRTIVSGRWQASLWSGTAASWVNLNPSAATISSAYALTETRQVGFAQIDGYNHASIWTGTPASWVDLHAFLPAEFSDSYAHGVYHQGTQTFVAGYGRNSARSTNEALLWIYSQPAVSGQVVFGDYFGPPIATALIEYKDLSFNVVHSENASLDPDGFFTVPTPAAAGSYYVSVKVGSWLRRTVGPIDTSSSVQGVALHLINGDVDEDNEVSVGDYSLLSWAFNSVPSDGNWNPSADLNGDLSVDIGDYAILSANYGEVGDG